MIPSKKTLKKVGAGALAVVLSTALAVSNAAFPALADSTDSSASTTNETPPTPPDGDSTPPDGDSTPPDGGNNAPGGMSSDSVNISYNAKNTYSSSKTLYGLTIKGTGKDENVIHVSGGTSTFGGLTLYRTNDSSTGGDNSSFYGVGAALLGTDGTTYLANSKITTNAKGGAGVFSYGDNTTYVSDTTINTKQSTSGGLHVAGGGTLYAYDVTATTQGESSAALRSDRGGGKMIVDGGTYTSNGKGSPAIYCTADIAVNDSDLVANGAEGICIEGLNNLRIFNSTLTGNMPDETQSDNTSLAWNVILYQSMSGDSQVGCSTFEMADSTLNAKNGGVFYTTNTESNFILRNVKINATDNDFLLRATGNANARGWGSTGSNGADCTFTAMDQTLEGDVIWDSISQLDFYLTDGSSLTGAVVDDETYAGTGGSGYANVYIDKDSTWTVTGNSTVTNLYNAGTIKDSEGKTVTVKTSSGTAVTGTSDVTITVTGTYSTTASLDNAGTKTSWSDYQKDKPTGLTKAAKLATTTVKKTTLKTAKSNSKKKMTLKWTKVSGVTGYQIQYSTSKNFNSKKTIYVSGASNVSRTISGLTSNKTYYVRIRSYKTISKTKKYSSYSTVKKVTVK
ncbi:MAG: fibronectin type III domain-containing protein [Lachnospiraceae bacterium]|nr:fibronectin type III domain-containing protein [Lachnospiraceae bacterium]